MSLSIPSQVSPTTGSAQSNPFVLAALGHRVGDERVAHDADAVRVGERDRRREPARLAHPLEPGHLAVAVEHVGAREQLVVAGVVLAREDHRDAGAHVLALDQRDRADLHARDVGDRVVLTGRRVPEPDPSSRERIAPRTLSDDQRRRARGRGRRRAPLRPVRWRTGTHRASWPAVCDPRALCLWASRPVAPAVTASSAQAPRQASESRRFA